MVTLQQPARAPQQRRRRWTLQRAMIILVTLIGAGVLLYPTAADWFSARAHDTEISGYVNKVSDLAQGTQDELLEQARKYNAELPAGPLRDPYSLNDQGQKESVGSGSEVYKSLLAVDSNGMMGTISIPSIHTNLPIFHGTSEDTLTKGAGHLFGSSLPVGGINTHSVITAHSGYVSATLFDDLKKVAQGDVFTVSVLGETLYYQVDQILTVLPEDAEELRQVKGKDYITLITCTPTGVNTHRLLVRGERIEAPVNAADAPQTMASNSTNPGFPWWALILAGTGLLAAVLTRPRGRRAAAKGWMPGQRRDHGRRNE